jgi:5-methyltetrahydropteroyltriglutamate--homocysteine methyltransferase
VVAKQEATGLQGVTDGEFSRDWWHLDFLSQLEGVALRENPGPKFGGTEDQPPIPVVTGKLRYQKPIMVGDFLFLKQATAKTAKFTIPSPSMLHLRAGRAGISQQAYPDLEAFWHDAAAAYRNAIAEFAKAGCSYLQSTTSPSPIFETRRSATTARVTAMTRRRCRAPMRRPSIARSRVAPTA